MSEILKLSAKIIARDRLKQAQEDYKQKELEYALEICPLKIGDKVKICGWAHEGKTGVVTQIKGIDSFRGHWRAYGIVLKKDGSKSLNGFDFWQEDYEKDQK